MPVQRFVARRSPIVDPDGLITRELQLFLQGLVDHVNDMEKRVEELEAKIQTLQGGGNGD